MKINIELNLPGDGRTFLNFWNWYNGDDVVCELIDGKLMLSQLDVESRELPAKEISFIEFLKMVETRGEFNVKACEELNNRKK